MNEIGLAESIIENEIGCGLFQILIVLFLFVFIKITTVFTFMFMTYGGYNPGWTCLDNNTLSHGFYNDSQQSPLTRENITLEYSKELSCEAFQACGVTQFNPESKTIVTEWGLVCDRAWISSLIISIQMAGNLVGSFFSGQVADSIGRKKTLYGSLMVNIVLTAASTLSTSWELFAAFRFFIGIDTAFFESLNYVFPAEFLSRKWRGPIMGVPGWAIGGIIFGFTTMLLKNWKYVLLASCVVFTGSIIPTLWVPESLRWLEVKNKTKDFEHVVRKMAKMNGTTIEHLDELNRHTTCQENPNIKQLQKIDTAKYTVIDLFRRGYCSISLIIAFGWTCVSLIFYSISYGVKALSGNFYINVILIYTISIPFNVFPLFATNVLGRRRASFVFVLISGLSCFVAMALQLTTAGDVQMIVVLVFVIIGLVSADTAWTSQQVHLTEIYPTVIRGVAMNWANVMARVGGIIAPFLIPSDSDSVYVWYLIMGCLAVVSCFLFTRLPETKGKPLKDTFEKIEEDCVVGVNEDVSI